MPAVSEELSTKVLELDIILDKVSSLAQSSIGHGYVKNLPFIRDQSELKRQLQLVSEMKELINFNDGLPLHPFTDFSSQLKRIEIHGAYLRGEEFLVLSNFLEMVRSVKSYMEKKEDQYPFFFKMVQHLIPIRELEQKIHRVIDRSGNVKNDASKELGQVRRLIENKSSQTKKKLTTILQSMLSHGYAQEGFLVLRDGRLVIPMKENHVNKLKGIVVDQSSSGATIYIEPLEVLEVNNQIRRLQMRERNEIEKILIHLTEDTQGYQTELKGNLRWMGQLDCLYARGQFSIEIDGRPPYLTEQFSMDIREARHPILLLKWGKEKVVPLNLHMNDQIKTLVITGPNAGGKTVSIKTVGLLALMNQLGLHIPVKEGTTMPMFSGIYADIGDQQSIEQDLSTFSSHMKTIQKFLNKVDPLGLVLLDEIGSSTDPQEGAALASVLLRAFAKQGGFTIVTTHLGELKVFAHETPGIENGSMVFDHKTLQPTYSFQMGLPGSSYAFEISERLGIETEIIQEAKKLVGEAHGKLDQLILHLEKKLHRTEGLLKEADIKESRLSGLLNLYQDQIQKIQEESEERKKQILKETESVLDDANKLVERVVREIREKQAEKISIREAKREISSLKQKVKSITEKQKITQPEIHIGAWILWKSHQGQGQVLSKPDNHGRITVQWNGKKLRIPSEDVEVTSPPHTVVSGLTQYFRNEDIQDEIDLRGLTTEEAIELVDKYLSDASVIGFTQVRVIHGKGTGVLRREIGAYLTKHRFVKKSRLGYWNEGDTGVTIVDLK